jgi:hypothetical protein
VGGEITPLRKGGLGRVDGSVDIFLKSLVDFTYFLAVVGVVDFEPPALFCRDELWQACASAPSH